MSVSNGSRMGQETYGLGYHHRKFGGKFVPGRRPVLTHKQLNTCPPSRSNTDSTSNTQFSSNTQSSSAFTSPSIEMIDHSPGYGVQAIDHTTQSAQFSICPPIFPSLDFMNSSYTTNMVPFDANNTLAPDEIMEFTEIPEELHDNKEINDGSGYSCTAPNCDNKTAFTRASDLKRHQREHSGAKHKYHCGCCKNMGQVPTYCCHRKDRMKQHIGKKHSRKGFEVCKVAPCNDGIELAFSSKSCLLLHKRDNHGLTESEENELDGEIRAAASSDTVTNGCFRFHIPLPPPKRVKRNDNENASVTKRRSELFLKDNYSKMNGGSPTANAEVSGFRPQIVAGVGEWSNDLEVSSSLSESDLPNLSGLPVLPTDDEDMSCIRKCVSLDIENVPPSDFLVGLNALRSIQANLIKRSLRIEVPVEETYISYCFFKKMLKIHGPILEAQKARADVVDSVCFGQKGASPSNPQMHCTAKKTFMLREEEDAELIAAWEKHVLPSLPKILRPVVGNEYSACIVRQRHSKRNTMPYIQIESPKLPSKTNKKAIKQALIPIFHDRLCSAVPKIHFYKGRTACLGLEYNSDEDNEEDEESSPFRFERTYWKRLGMSGSIGLMGSKSVSATSGGYILVNGQLRLLLPNHFVEESTSRLNEQSYQQQGLMHFTSPSLADVYECRDHLQRILKKHEAIAEKVFECGLEDLSIDYISEFLQDKDLDAILESHNESEINEIVLSKRLLQDLERQEDDFVLGHVTDRCSTNDKPSIRDCVVPKHGENGINKIKMDWALGEVTIPDREGTNQHRYPLSKDSGELDYGKEGRGSACEHTRPLNPGAKVYYVGCTSGLRRGNISTTRMLISKNGYQTCEWYMIPEQQDKLEYDNCAGDSGAWVITSSGNYLMAQLWGHSLGNLLISPIDEVFKDIKDVTGAKTVELPDRNGRPHPGTAPYEEICRRVRPARGIKKPSGFDNKNLPSLRQILETMPPPARANLLSQNVEKPSEYEPTARPTLLDVSLHLPPPPPAPNSPVPSLTSSISSQDRKSPTPVLQRSPTTPTLPSYGPPQTLPNASEPFILRAAETGLTPPQFAQEPESLEEKWHDTQYQQREYEAAGSLKRKVTVESMLDSIPNKDVIRAVTERVLANPQPTRPPRRSGTFPMFSNNPVPPPLGLFSNDPMPAPRQPVAAR